MKLILEIACGVLLGYFVKAHYKILLGIVWAICELSMQIVGTVVLQPWVATYTDLPKGVASFALAFVVVFIAAFVVRSIVLNLPKLAMELLNDARQSWRRLWFVL